jgi:hypothetical protein
MDGGLEIAGLNGRGISVASTSRFVFLSFLVNAAANEDHLHDQKQ